MCNVFVSVADSTDWSLLVAILAFALSFVSAWWQYRSQRSKEFAGVAIAALNSAFSALTNDQLDVLPRAVRANWIESARQIEHYKKILTKVTSKEYREICAQSESAVCYKFYAVLRRIPITVDYFQKDVQLYPGSERENDDIGLEHRSVAVVFSFGFRARKDDPLDSVDVGGLFCDGHALNANPALGMFLEKFGVK